MNIRPIEDAFSFRVGESLSITEEMPSENEKFWFAAVIVPVSFPDGGPVCPMVSGEMPQLFGLFFCQKTESGWQWLQMAPGSKEAVGTVMQSCGCEPGIWYYVSVHET